MNDHELEQLVHFPTSKNTLDIIMTSVPAQFVDIHSPDRLSDRGIVSRTFKVIISLNYYRKGYYESMRTETLKCAKNTRSVQENFNLSASFIQGSANEYILFTTSRSVASVP